MVRWPMSSSGACFCLRLFVVVCCLLNHGIRWIFLLPASLRTRGNSLFLHTLTYGVGGDVTVASRYRLAAPVLWLVPAAFT